MAHSFAALYYHLIFSTKNRRRWIDPAWEDRLYGFLGSVVKRKRCRLLKAGGDRDHVHLASAHARDVAPAEILRVLKSTSSGWIKETLELKHFAWQEGYAAFTVSRSQLPALIRYIETQKERHRTKTFREELMELFRLHDIEFDPEDIP
jgi:putative transposase